MSPKLLSVSEHRWYTPAAAPAIDDDHRAVDPGVQSAARATAFQIHTEIVAQRPSSWTAERHAKYLEFWERFGPKAQRTECRMVKTWDSAWERETK